MNQNYENEYFEHELIYQLIKILNDELTKINSKEKIYFIEDYPITIIFLNLKIYSFFRH